MRDSAGTAEAYGSLNAILPLLELLEQRGLDPLAVLDRAGIPAAARARPDTRLPQSRFEALWRAAVERTGDPAIALRASTLARPSTLGIIGYLASASDSPRNAFELVRGLTPLLWEGFACALECDEAVAFMRFEVPGGAGGSRFVTEYSVGLAIAMSRSLGRGRSDPLEARFAHAPPAYADEYPRILGLPVRFEAGEDGVLFPISLLDRSNPSADAALRALLVQYAADQLARIPGNPRTAERARASIRAGLGHGELTAAGVAAQLGMSERTLRRRLRDEGTSYQRVLDAVRAELAEALRAEGTRSLEEIALRLGFCDASALAKAARRWSGHASEGGRSRALERDRNRASALSPARTPRAGAARR